ncbi:hypothetical protein [Leptospira meyeri]|uniref:hypothetical protein n=1 Tax=Leptospira meyeri TaxID=29508 RepID=UPI00223D6CD8|nr:hypothetical protein [Leptospira meyeri]MCW7487871.1 hypothetical protein [Leptospira meyeri]
MAFITFWDYEIQEMKFLAMEKVTMKFFRNVSNFQRQWKGKYKINHSNPYNQIVR